MLRTKLIQKASTELAREELFLLYLDNEWAKVLDHLDPDTPAYDPQACNKWYEYGLSILSAKVSDGKSHAGCRRKQ
jgi:hypothetical protein